MHAADQPGSMSRSAQIGWWIFVLLACAQFTIRYVWRNAPYLDLPAYANGTGMMPFQGRVLMAWVLKATAANPHWSGVLTHMGAHLPEDLRSPYSAMVGCILAGRSTLQHLTGNTMFSAWASLLLLYMTYFNLVVGYGLFILPYDVLSLTIFVVSVWLVITKRYAALTLVVAIGTLNRETIIFIPLFLALYTWFKKRLKPADVHGRRFCPTWLSNSSSGSHCGCGLSITFAIILSRGRCQRDGLEFAWPAICDH
jgi:hypothetical protein